MGKELTTRESTDVALSKSKSFMGIIKNIFNNKVVPEDDGWMQRLWDWADENYITDLEWVDDDTLTEGGYRTGLSRNKELLLNSKTLNLEYNELLNIPKEIGKIINLSELYLSSNRLEHIPNEIGNLVNLTILMISANQLVDLPKEIGNLNKLLKLALPNNQLVNLPREIGKLSDLTALRLDNNKLYELPKEVENLKSLIMVELSDNKFKKLPEVVFQLTNLENLYFYGNDICEISEKIGNLLNLTALGLGENKIKSLPKEIGNLTNLLILGLAENNLEALPSEICNLVDLNHLNIENNQLKKLPDEIYNLKNLELLVLTNNPLILTDKQKDWINQLIDDGCDVKLDDDTWGRSIHTKKDTKNKKNSLSSYFNHASKKDLVSTSSQNKEPQSTEESDSLILKNSIQGNLNKIVSGKYSNEEILGTSYNMIREVFEESDGIKPISNNASFFMWSETIRVLKEDNGESFIKLDDGTGYAIAYDSDKIIFIVKEVDGTPAFVNQQFYQKFYQEIYKHKNI